MAVKITVTSALRRLERRTCDKCGTSLRQGSKSNGFEQWSCPHCQQVLTHDPDRQTGGWYQQHRGQPWKYDKSLAFGGGGTTKVSA
jgi:hypothetical protein